MAWRFGCGLLLAGCLLAVCLPVCLSVSPQHGLTSANVTQCNSTVGGEGGTLVFPPEGWVGRGVCTVTVEGRGGRPFSVVLTSLRLQGEDTLTLSDGRNQTLMANLTGYHEGLVAVVMSGSAILSLNISSNSSSSVVYAAYNTSACVVQQTVNADRLLWSPQYLTDRTDFNCTYIFNLSSEVTGSILSVSFTNVSLTNSTLNITATPPSTTPTIINGTSLPPDVFGNNTLHMVFTVPKSPQPQIFSGVITPVTSSSDCGKLRVVNGTAQVQLAVPSSIRPSPRYDCRVVVEGVKGRALRLNVTSLTLGGQGDLVEVVDGGGRGGRALASFSSSLNASPSSSSGYLLLSTQRQVLVRMTLGLTMVERSVTITVTELDAVHHLYNSGLVTLTPPTSTNQSTSYFLLETSPPSVIRVELGPENVSLTYNYTVSVYDGDQTSSPLLLTFRDSQRVNVTSSSSRCLLEVTMTHTSHSLNVSFTSRPTTGCDVVTSRTEGRLRLVTSPAVPPHCTWTLTPPPSPTGSVLLDVSRVRVAGNASLSVYSGVLTAPPGGRSRLILRLTKGDNPESTPTITSLALPTSVWSQVVWSRENSTGAQSVMVDIPFLVLTPLCGGEVQTSKGILQSPSFPNLYPLNSACLWTFPPPHPPTPTPTPTPTPNITTTTTPKTTATTTTPKTTTTTTTPKTTTTTTTKNTTTTPKTTTPNTTTTTPKTTTTTTPKTNAITSTTSTTATTHNTTTTPHTTTPPPPPANGTQLLFLDFAQFQLAANHSVTVMISSPPSSSSSLFFSPSSSSSSSPNTSWHQVASFNGSGSPPDLLIERSHGQVIALNFSAQSTTTAPASPVSVSHPVSVSPPRPAVAQGFQLRYWSLTCGGSTTNQTVGSVSTPGFPALLPVGDDDGDGGDDDGGDDDGGDGGRGGRLCVWILRVPPVTPDGEVNILNLTFDIRSSGSPAWSQMIQVHDGNSLRHQPMAWNVSQGDNVNISALSLHNEVVIVFNTTAGGHQARSPPGLALRVNFTTFSCNHSSLCHNSGLCIHPDWRCNGVDDCGDNTDEHDCLGPPSPSSSASSGSSPAVVAVLFFVGMAVGAVVVAVVPRIVRRLRTNRYSTFRDDPPLA